MKYYFDESGTFRPSASTDAFGLGIVVGIAIPDDLEASLFQCVQDLLRTVVGSRCDGEVKGSHLSLESRTAFSKFLSARAAVLVCPSVLDLRLPPELDVSEGLAQKIFDVSRLCKHASQRAELELLSKQVRNLSKEQILRLVTWSRSARRSIQDSIIYFCEATPTCRWSSVKFAFDAVQTRPGSREEKVLHAMLPNWTVSATLTDPITLIEEIHDELHPLVQNYCVDAGVDVGKMFKGNLEFLSSKQSIGVQIADIAAAVIRCAMSPEAVDEDIRNYARLMTRTLRGGLDCVGIFSIDVPPVADWQHRYESLIHAIDFASNFRV